MAELVDTTVDDLTKGSAVNSEWQGTEIGISNGKIGNIGLLNLPSDVVTKSSTYAVTFTGSSGSAISGTLRFS
jgi:hypothetical protein